MRTLSLILVGVVVGWAASGVDWTRKAVGQDGVRNPHGGEESRLRDVGPDLQRRVEELTPEIARKSIGITFPPMDRRRAAGLTSLIRRPVKFGKFPAISPGAW